MFFFASATNFSKPVCSGITKTWDTLDKDQLEDAKATARPAVAPYLFVAEGFDRVEGGGFASWIETEENSDGGAEHKRHDD